MENLRELIELQDISCYVLEPAYMDEAALEITTGSDGEPCVQYSVSKILELLQSEEGMTEDDALEWFYYNIESASYGEGSPVFRNDHLPDGADDDED